MNFSLVSGKSSNPLAGIARNVVPIGMLKNAQRALRGEEPSPVKVSKKVQKIKMKKMVYTSETEKKKTPAGHSATERFLKGRKLPGYETHGNIQEVMKQGATRSVRFADGTVRRIPKEKLVSKFNASLREHGAAEEMKAVKLDRATGRATVSKPGRFGPGIERTYDSVGRANAAIRRRYGVQSKKA